MMKYLNGASDSNMLSHQIFALYYAHFKTLLFLQEKKIGTAGLSLTQSLLQFFLVVTISVLLRPLLKKAVGFMLMRESINPKWAQFV